jgi:hypothetical protein
MEPEVAAAILLWRRQKTKKKKRLIWIHPVNEKREELGEFMGLIMELRKDDRRFTTYFRMKVEHFDLLLSKIKDRITKKNTNYRSPLQPELRLAITLR